MLLTLVMVVGVLTGVCVADTPANCTVDDVLGEWVFKEGSRGHTYKIDCSTSANFDHQIKIRLDFPNVASDNFGHTGKWTMIYNQGFEVAINYRKYFAFSDWQTVGNKTTSFCHKTKPGWSHDVYVRDWSCFQAEKMYQSNRRMVHKINHIQKSWKAKVYQEFDDLTLEEMVRKLGGHKSKVQSRPKPSEVSRLTQMMAESLPEKFDWRNVEGDNFVSPIRNQGTCGSCYSFASAAMLEARYRILTNNTQKPVFAPQDVVQCSEYSQGCAGGFPYLIAGKYAEDFGMVLESCNPYSLPEPHTGTCRTNVNCRRYYATDYRYVGGYYGACNEPLMKWALVHNGPLAVGFEVYHDFMAYSKGVYHHTQIKDTLNYVQLGGDTKWDPFQLTNHAVLVVGYGTDKKSGEDYWLVKNSWGPQWGEGGFFRIRRGTDECGIESMAMESTPIITY